MKKPNGIFSILDSTCIQPRGSDAVFTQNLFQVHGNSNVISPVTRAPSAAGAGRRGSQFDRMNGFKVKHYAGEVTYDAAIASADSPNDLRLMIKLGADAAPNPMDATDNLTIEEDDGTISFGGLR